MENYRGRFAAAVAVAADAKFNLPKRWLEALESQGVGPDEIFAPPASEGMLAKLSRDDKRRILEAAARASEREMDVELSRIRAINDATIAEIAAADAATGELLARSLQGNYVDARRRRMVFVAEAMLQVPAAQAAPIAERFSAYLKVEEAEALVLAKPLIPASRTDGQGEWSAVSDRARESRRKLSLQGREHEVLARANDFEVRVGV
jgi:hypothetical protein